MSIYTANGDKGTTNLVHTKNVSKSDDRIQLVGTIDELSSHLGLIKTMMSEADDIRFILRVCYQVVQGIFQLCMRRQFHMEEQPLMVG